MRLFTSALAAIPSVNSSGTLLATNYVKDCFRRAKGIHWDTSEVPNPDRTMRIVKADGEIMEVDPVTGKEVKATEPVAAGDAKTRKIRLVDQEQ